MDVKERDWGFGVAWVIAFDSGWGRRVKKEREVAARRWSGWSGL